MLLETAEVLWTARYDYDPGWVLPIHSHRFFQAVYLLSGEGRVILGGAEDRIHPAHLFFVPPGIAHGLSAATRVRTLDMKFDVHDEELARELQDIGAVYIEAGAPYRAVFDKIREEGESRAAMFREMCSIHLAELLVLLRRAGWGRLPACQSGGLNACPAGDTLTRMAMDFVGQHVAEGITVRRLSRQLGCSERAVRQHFRQAIGASPLEQITRYRIEKAENLIQESDYPLKEIAAMVGFQSIHHFTRVFHRVTGMAPAAWRELYARGVRKDIIINPRFRNTHWLGAKRA